MGRIRLVAIDVDGVIRDVSALLYECHKAALREIGLDRDFERSFTPEELWHFKGLGKFNSRFLSLPTIAAVLREGKSEQLKKMIHEVNAEDHIGKLVSVEANYDIMEKLDQMASVYAAKFNSDKSSSLITIYPKLDEVISRLEMAGKKVGIVTNSTRSSLERDIPQKTLKGLSGIVTRESVKMLKPSGEGLRMISSMSGVGLDETIYIGDTVVDVLACKDAGCTSASVLSGMGLRQHLKRQGTDAIFKDLDEAAAWILER